MKALIGLTVTAALALGCEGKAAHQTSYGSRNDDVVTYENGQVNHAESTTVGHSIEWK